MKRSTRHVGIIFFRFVCFFRGSNRQKEKRLSWGMEVCWGNRCVVVRPMSNSVEKVNCRWFFFVCIVFFSFSIRSKADYCIVYIFLYDVDSVVLIRLHWSKNRSKLITALSFNWFKCCWNSLVSQCFPNWKIFAESCGNSFKIIVLFKLTRENFVIVRSDTTKTSHKNL